MNRAHWLGCVLVVTWTLLPAVGRAQVPPQFIYEGYLTDGGVPVQGTRSLTFSLYPGATGGSPVWTEIRSSVTVTEGYLAVMLGELNALEPEDVTTGPWLEVSVDGTVLGRQPLVAVPFALQAQTVDWGSIRNMPSDFADGVDNVASGSGGGTVTSIAAGTGLSATPSSPITVSGTLSVDFGSGSTQVARGDHNHDAAYAPIAHAHDTLYYTKAQADSAYAASGHDHDADYAAITHSHDDRYYSEHESDLRFARLDQDASFGDLSATNLTLTNPPGVTNPPLKTKSWWAGEACWTRTLPSGTPSRIEEVVNYTKLGCTSPGGATDPEVRIFLSGVPDRITIKEWGIFGGQPAGTGENWTCELKKDHIEDSRVDTLTWPNLTTNTWQYTVQRTGLNIVVDNGSDALRSPWQVRCVGGPNAKHRLFIAVFLRYTEN